MVFDEEKCFDLLKSLTRRCSDTRLVVSESFLKPLITILMGKKDKGRSSSSGSHWFFSKMNDLKVRQKPDGSFEYDLQILLHALKEIGCPPTDTEWGSLLCKLEQATPNPATNPVPMAAPAAHGPGICPARDPPPLPGGGALVAAGGGAGTSSLVELPSQPKSKYHTMQKGNLINKLVKLERKHQEKATVEYQLKQKLKRSEKKVDQMADQVKNLEGQIAELSGAKYGLEIQQKKSSRLTHRGQFALGIRRNFTNVACSDVGALLLQPLDRWAVARAEVHTGSGLLLSSHKFNTGSAPLIVRALEFDATNSSIWQKRSLNACRLETLKFSSWLEDGLNLTDVSVHQRRWCDLLPVENKSARGTYSLVAKHLHSAGVPRLWRDEPAECEGEPQITAWACCTDRGSDCVGCRAMIVDEAGPCDIPFQNDCGKHAGHCIVQATLKLADMVLAKLGKEYKYYATLTKLIHLWRDMAKDFYDTWVVVFTAVDANKCARTLPPTCVAGRWNSVELTEIRLDDMGVSRVVKVMMLVISKNSQQKQIKRKVTLDDCSLQEQHFYSEKMSKWKSEVASAITDVFFIKMVEVSKMLRTTTSHYMNSLSVGRAKDQTTTPAFEM